MSDPNPSDVPWQACLHALGLDSNDYIQEITSRVLKSERIYETFSAAHIAILAKAALLVRAYYAAVLVYYFDDNRTEYLQELKDTTTQLETIVATLLRGYGWV